MSNEAIVVGETALLRQARDKFVATFNRSPTVAACAPGRVNLIGDHIDYCEGYVLPIALPFLTLIVGDYNNTPVCRIVTTLATGQELETSFLAPTPETALKPGEPAWSNYFKGVVANFPGTVRGFDVVIVSDVPMGSGLSSSAAIEVATFTFLQALTGTQVDPVKRAQLCQKAEHEFPGMPCGIMDQYISSLGRKDHALLIDCRSLKSTQIPLETDDAVILTINSNVKHQLTGSEYPQRRAQCQEAADKLKISSLRTANIEDLEGRRCTLQSNSRLAHSTGLFIPLLQKTTLKSISQFIKFLTNVELKRLNCDELVLKRARHVINEINYTVEVAKSLREKDLQRVGELFYKSHESLSKLMEVSCPELDDLVDIIRGSPGVYGARMTGGGFGGCVVTLVDKSHVEDLKRKILALYKATPTFFVCQPSDGARVIKLQ